MTAGCVFYLTKIYFSFVHFNFKPIFGLQCSTHTLTRIMETNYFGGGGQKHERKIIIRYRFYQLFKRISKKIIESNRSVKLQKLFFSVSWRKRERKSLIRFYKYVHR